MLQNKYTKPISVTKATSNDVTLHFISQTHSHKRDVTQGQFLAEFKRFEIRVFFLLDQLP